MVKHINVTEDRYEVGTDGVAYVIHVYDLSNRPEAERQMTNQSVGGWRIVASHIYTDDNGPRITVVWEWRGKGGGIHYRLQRPYYQL